MLAHRRRRWPNINTTLGQGLLGHYRSLTSISVCLHSVAILESSGPRAFIFRARRRALPCTVTTFETLCPFALVHPVTFDLYAKAVAFSLHPLTLKTVAAGPGVDPAHLETARPGSRVLALPLRPGTDSKTVSLTVLPTPTIRPSIIEIESPSPAHGAASPASPPWWRWPEQQAVGSGRPCDGQW